MCVAELFCTCLGACSRSVAVVVSCIAWLFPGLGVILRDKDATSWTPRSVMVTWTKREIETVGFGLSQTVKM